MRKLQDMKYKKKTGKFFDLKGEIVTTSNNINVDGKNFTKAQLAYLLVYGTPANHPIYFKNRDKTDLRFKNLDSKPPMIRRNTVNKHGYRGISPAKNDKWQSLVVLDKKLYHLGTYDTKEEASFVYELSIKMNKPININSRYFNAGN